MSEKDEEQDKGFKVNDKRRFTINGEGNVVNGDAEEEKAASPKPATEAEEKIEPEAAAENQEAEQEAPKKTLRDRVKEKLSGSKPQEDSYQDHGQPMPELDFMGFIFSLSTSVLIHFGEMEDPTTGQKSKNLVAAKQTIDLLGILEEKTKGNLTDHEERFLHDILYDLRMRFVKLSSKKPD